MFNTIEYKFELDSVYLKLCNIMYIYIIFFRLKQQKHRSCM